MATNLSKQQQSLVASLADQPEIAGTLELVWRQARASLPSSLLDEWVGVSRGIAARVGSNAAIAFIRNSPSVAAAAGPRSVMALAELTPEFATLAGDHTALALLVAAPLAARRLGNAQNFAEWLRVIKRIAEAAPESVSLLLEKSGRVLDSLDVRSFETWALGHPRRREQSRAAAEIFRAA